MKIPLLIKGTISYLIGILIFFFYSIPVPILIVTTLFLLFVSVLLFIKNKRNTASILALLLVTLLGGINISYKRGVIESQSIQKQQYYYLKVNSDPTPKDYGYSCDALLNNIKVRLYLESKEPIHYGDIIKTSFSPEELEPPLLKAFFDYQRYLWLKEIKYHRYYSTKSYTITSNQPSSIFLSKIYAFRHTLAHRIDNHLPKPHNTILKALLLGLRSEVPTSIHHDFAQTGTLHVMAVSGLHVGIVFWVFSIFTQKKRRLIILSIIGIWLFTAITGFSISVVRAAIMLTLVQVGTIIKRDQPVEYALLATALTMLAINPFIVFDVGFQFSFGSVLSIILFVPLFQSYYSHFPKLKRYFMDIIVVSISVQFFVVPLVLMYMHSYSFLTIISNLFMIPYTFLIVFFGLFFLITPSLFAPIVDAFIYSQVFYLKILGSFSFANLEHIPFSHLDALFLMFIMISFYFFFRKKRYKYFILLSLSIITYTGIRTIEVHIKTKKNQIISVRTTQEEYIIINNSGSISYIPIRVKKNFNKYTLNPYLVRHALFDNGKHPYKKGKEGGIFFTVQQQKYLYSIDEKSTKNTIKVSPNTIYQVKAQYSSSL